MPFIAIDRKGNFWRRNPLSSVESRQTPALESKANKPQQETPTLETKPKPTIPNVLTPTPPALDTTTPNSDIHEIIL